MKINEEWKKIAEKNPAYQTVLDKLESIKIGEKTKKLIEEIKEKGLIENVIQEKFIIGFLENDELISYGDYIHKLANQIDLQIRVLIEKIEEKIVHQDDLMPIIEVTVLTQILADHLENIDIYSLHELEEPLGEDDKSSKILNLLKKISEDISDFRSDSNTNFNQIRDVFEKKQKQLEGRILEGQKRIIQTLKQDIEKFVEYIIQNLDANLLVLYLDKEKKKQPENILKKIFENIEKWDEKKKIDFLVKLTIALEKHQVIVQAFKPNLKERILNVIKTGVKLLLGVAFEKLEEKGIGFVYNKISELLG